MKATVGRDTSGSSPRGQAATADSPGGPATAMDLVATLLNAQGVTENRRSTRRLLAVPSFEQVADFLTKPAQYS